MIPMSLGTSTFDCWSVGRASRLSSKDLRTPARRPRYILSMKKTILTLLSTALAIGLSTAAFAEDMSKHILTPPPSPEPLVEARLGFRWLPQVS